MKKLIILIIFNSLNLILLITSLIVIQWKNLWISNLILFLIMASYNFLNLIIVIFILLKKCLCSVERTSLFFLIFTILFSCSINVLEIIFFSVSVDDVNYPCNKKNDCENCSTNGGYYIYYYYYYRRLTPEYDCDKLPIGFYTGIITKKERIVGFITLPLTIAFNIVSCVFWRLLGIRDSYKYRYESCDCHCPSCSCSCSCCCFNKRIKEETKNVDVKVNNKNTDSNDIKMDVDIEIHPTEPKSKEPIQEKIA